MARARYDGYAEWYDEHLTRFTGGMTDCLLELLGDGPGRCLDLGCGGGIHLAGLAERSWKAIGVDLSADQLRVARRRVPEAALVQTDVVALPFGDASFDAVVAPFVHTDLDDPAGAFTEAARVLRPGGRFVHIGVHPCFVGPFSTYPPGVDSPILHRGYRDTAWTSDAPGLGDGLGRRVGVHHVPLADLFNAALVAGFILEHVREPGEDDYPRVLAFTAHL